MCMYNGDFPTSRFNPFLPTCLFHLCHMVFTTSHTFIVSYIRMPQYQNTSAPIMIVYSC